MTEASMTSELSRLPLATSSGREQLVRRLFGMTNLFANVKQTRSAVEKSSVFIGCDDCRTG
jgi:hypothetical protein